MVASNGRQASIVEILGSKRRTVSAEIIPPRNGIETDKVLRQIACLKEVPVDFISVTKGAGGSLRGGTLPIAQMIKSQFSICSLAHFTCRDYTIEEIENTLMDHHYFGVTNILALRGDPPDGIPDHFKPAPNRHQFAFELVQQIQDLNNGNYLARAGYDRATGPTREGTRTEFCIGVAAHPENEPFEQAVEHFSLKVKSGAQYAITQMLFSAAPYARFLEACAKKSASVPIIPGIRILTQASTAHRMRKKFGINVPTDLIENLERQKSSDDARKLGLEAAYQLCQDLFQAGAPGVHVFVMNDEQTAAELLKSVQ